MKYPLGTLFLIATFWAPWAHAQTTSARPPFVRAVGNASVSAKADQVKIDFGVVTQAATAQDASTQNATQVANVLTQLRALLGAGADIKTISYSLTPNYTYPPGGNPILQGYTATNMVEVTSENLASANIGNIIDTAVAAGANRVQSLQFLIKDDSPMRAQALQMAAVQARTQANAIATGLGVKLGAVLAATDSASSNIQPLTPSTAFAATTTPVQPGLIEVRATVTLELAII